MRITHCFRAIVEVLAQTKDPRLEEVVDSLPKREGSDECVDITSVFSLAKELHAAHCFQDENNKEYHSALDWVEGSDGGIGVMQAAIDFAWIFECEACDILDWNTNGEVWPYWLEDHAEEILRLTEDLREPDETFRERAREYLRSRPEFRCLKEGFEDE